MSLTYVLSCNLSLCYWTQASTWSLHLESTRPLAMRLLKPHCYYGENKQAHGVSVGHKQERASLFPWSFYQELFQNNHSDSQVFTGFRWVQWSLSQVRPTGLYGLAPPPVLFWFLFHMSLSPPAPPTTQEGEGRVVNHLVGQCYYPLECVCSCSFLAKQTSLYFPIKYAQQCLIILLSFPIQ